MESLARYATVGVLVLAGISCAEGRSPPREGASTDSLSTPLLTGPVKRLIGASRLLGGPDDFGLLFGFDVINDEYLLVGDAAADLHILVVDIESGAVVTSFGATGEGPREFQGPHRISPDPTRADTWWVYDFSAWTWTPVTMVGDDASNWEIGDRYSLQGVPVAPETPMWVEENEALIHGVFSGYAIVRAEFDPNTRQVSEWSPIEMEQPFKDIPEPGLSLLNRSFIATRPSGGFAIAYQYDNWIEVRDREDLLVRKIDGPREVTPDYFFDDDNRFHWGQEDQNGYVGAHGIESGFYLLWCGAAECRRTMAIHEFDWDGNFIQEFGIVSVTDLAISSTGDRLWGFTHEHLPPQIAEWDLSN